MCGRCGHDSRVGRVAIPGRPFRWSHVYNDGVGPDRRFAFCQLAAGETRNISANGVLFQVESEMPIGSSVEFEISMSPEILGAPIDVAVKCRGRVVRSFQEGDQRWAGVVIDEYKFQRR